MIEILLTILVAVVPAVVLHECAHGWVANLLGDPTAKDAGRLTLNPLKHVDPVGTIIIPGILFLLYFTGINKTLMLFGWAKPVPVDFRKFKNPRRDMVWVALAGPMVNIILAYTIAQVMTFALPAALKAVLFHAVLINLALAVFNLMPIPPLDGGRIVTGLLPAPLSREFAKLETIGFILVLILLNLGLLNFLYPAIEFFLYLFKVQIP